MNASHETGRRDAQRPSARRRVLAGLPLLPGEDGPGTRGLARGLARVGPVVDARTPFEAIRQIMDFMRRGLHFSAGVPDTSFFPFSAICRLELDFSGQAYHGTGFYIAPDLILTCGHNLFDSVDGHATSVTVNVGQRDASTRLARFTVQPDDWSVHPRWQSSGGRDDDFDLAVIRVRNTPPGGQFFRLINYSPVPETPIAVCGYSGGDADGQKQNLDIDRIRRLEGGGERVAYNLQTRPGASGSPVFAHYPDHNSGGMPADAIPVMAVHTHGVGDGRHNGGVLLTPEKIDWIQGRGLVSVSRSLSALARPWGGTPPVHLPDGRVLTGWQSRAAVAAIDSAIALAAAGNPALSFLATFINTRAILAACQRLGVTVGLGPAVTGGLFAGGTAGAGVLFTNDGQIGFYGQFGDVTGWIMSISASAQFTAVRGGADRFGGNSRVVAASVGTVGWFSSGLLDVPVGGSVILNTSDEVVGVSFEVGLSLGVPILSLIEAVGQRVQTGTTIPQSVTHALSTVGDFSEARQAALEEALAAGADTEEARRFVDGLFT